MISQRHFYELLLSFSSLKPRQFHPRENETNAHADMLWRAIPCIVRLGVFRQRRFLLRRALLVYAGGAVARLGRELFVLVFR